MRCRLTLCALCLALVFTAPAPAETLWENQGEYVKIKPRDGGGANRHPFRIDPQLLTRALSKLRVEPAGRRDDMLAENDDQPAALPLFTPETARRVAHYVADGLHDATPGDDVVFRAIDTAPLFGRALGKQVFTAARVFRRGHRLHLVFGGIHRGVKKRWLLGKEQGYVNAPEPGARGVPTALKLRVVEGPGVHNAKTRDGKKRLDWVIIEPRSLAASAPADKRRPARAARPPPPRPDESARSRLRRLERLYDDGLITKREYRAKRRDILDSL